MKKLSRALRSPEIEEITQRLTEGINAKAWVAEAKERRQGSGSAAPGWPDDQEKEFGIKIAFIELLATDPREAFQSSYVLYHTGTNINTNLNNMTRQLIVPFVRDYIDYLKGQFPVAQSLEPQQTIASAPAPVKAHAGGLGYARSWPSVDDDWHLCTLPQHDGRYGHEFLRYPNQVDERWSYRFYRRRRAHTVELPSPAHICRTAWASVAEAAGRLRGSSCSQP